jgi:urease accessory protein
LVDLRSAVPLTLRWADGCLYVVGSGFAPLGGDDLALDVVVDPGAALTVRTVAASIAQPSPSGEASRFAVTARVGAGGSLRWLPEPGVAAVGAVHHADAVVDLAAGAELVWREEVVLGRHGEPGGEWRSSLRVTGAGTPILVQATAYGGPSWASPAVGAGSRAAGSVLVVGPAAPTSARVLPTSAPARAAVLPLAHPGATLVSALAPDARTLRRLLDAGQEGDEGRRGRRTTSLAPPVSASVAVTEPDIASVSARTVASPTPVPGPPPDDGRPR